MLRAALCLLGIHGADRAVIWSKRKGRKRTSRYLCVACGREFTRSKTARTSRDR